MNNVILIGRLTRDPEVRYTAEEMAIATFTIAIDRPVKQGQEKKADFPRVITFGKTAENCERYIIKGRKVAVQGRIQTGSYTNNDGQKVYTTDVVANTVEFLDYAQQGLTNGNTQSAQQATQAPIPEGFATVSDDDIPF